MRAVPAAILRALIFAATAAGGSSAYAQGAAAAPPPEIADKIGLCASCHGPTGQPMVEKAPIIWGQHMFYLLTQLKDYRAERRLNEIMTPMAKELSDDEMNALATYFAAQPWPNYSEPRRPEDTAIAERLAVEGACTQCHLGNMLGDSRNPRLNHQKVDYTEQTLKDFRDDVRKNAPPMAAIVRDWSDDEIAAMSRYLAGL
jgi:cytochrome c553